MNKYCYRVIFSRTKQRFVVTSELSKSAVASSVSKKTNENPTALFVLRGWQNGLNAGLSAVNFALFLALGFVFMSEAQAEDLAIRADKSAPGNQQATVLQTANGLPQVNIQTPSAGGVSRNVYSQLDVAEKGAVFNNARKAVQTQLAGWVQGNPNLATGEAKVILNEVNSNQPSHLKGYMEVAGQKADVIIANPSGIHCDGCGVINAGRAGFTTGKPELEDGSLRGFNVQTGKVTVSGKGMDTSRADYTDIIAKEVEVKGGVWAQELKITTGQNRVSSSHDDVVYVGDKNAEKNSEKIDRTFNPRYAVDVSELGGMYAGKIRLVDNDNGLGVRNAGHIGATAGEVKIDSRGQIVNRGTINSPHDVSLSAQKDIDNSGNIESKRGNVQLGSGQSVRQSGSVIARQGDTDIRIKGKLNQSGETVSGGKIRIQAQSVQAERSALLAAGVEVTESAQGVTRTLSLQGNNSKDLVIDAEGQIVLNGKNVAAGNMSVTGAQIDLNHSQTAANNVDASARQGDIQANRANLTARENLTFATPKTLSAQYSQVTAKQFVTRQQIFDVEQGVWQQTGNGDFNLRAQQIKNNQGALITQGTLLTDADTIENRQGMIYSPRFLATAQKLDNENGEIYADDIHLTNQYFDNRKGRIYARTFNAVSQNLDNREGVLAATDLGLTSSTIQNQAVGGTGSLINGANLIIHVDTLNNQNTKATQSVPTQGILAGNLTIQANQLNNQQGGLYAEDSLKTTVENALRNTQGEILSANLVEIASRQARLTVDNSEGKIEAGNRLTLKAKTLAHEGSINTEGDAEIALKDDFTLNRAFGVNGNLTFSTEGNLKNNTVLRVGNKASISADAIENVANGEISATDTEITAQSLLNRGLIDGDKTVLNVTELENKGTGRIYGNHLAIQSHHLRNLNETVSGTTSAGTIAARERLDLGVGILTNYNHSLILSLNKLYIGGKLDANHEATGSAVFIDNGSADIEALGDGVINTTRLWNHDLHLVLGKKYDYEFIRQYHLLNSTTVYRTGVDGTMNWNNDNRHDKNAYFDFYDKSKSSIGSPDWIQEEFTRETITPTIEHQEPARISIGGNLDLRGDDLTNEASRFEIGRRLTLGNTDFVSNRLNSDLTGADGVQLKNIDIEDDIIRIDRGIAKTIGAERHHCGRHHCWGHYDHGSVKLDRVLPPLKYSFRFVSNPIGQGITNSGTDIAQKAYANQVSLTQLKVNSVSGTPTTIKTSRTDLSLPTASLYRINPKAGQYLVETDSRFTDRRQWLSSDYMLNALRTQNLLKRLGDGYYEQRLVNEQINQLTGRRFLEGYTSDYDQYKALMDSGIQYAQRFNLIPGVALTEEQMQNLTSDMVWLVKKRVTLADGTQTEVLAPQVYIVARNTDVDSQGAVISANDIIINTQGNIQNGGIIAGRNLTGLAANNIENLGGRLQGRDLYLFAKSRLLNAGGELSAGNSLLAQADNIEIESRVTESEKVTANSNKAGFSRREIDRVATVNVGEDSGGNGHAELFARENLSIKGANISVTGNAAFTALNRLSLGGVSTQNQEHIVPNADNYYKLDQSREVGSQINVTGDSRLTGKSAVDLTGVFLHNEGALQIASEGDIRVQASRSLERIASGSTSKSKGELSHSRTIKKHEHDYDLAQGSQLDADRIEISSAQGNVTIAGSDVVAEHDLSVQAKDIAVTADTNHVYEENYEYTKKSGVFGTGGIGVTFGSKSEKHDYASEGWTQSDARAVVGSLNGDIHIQAENHAQVLGTDIIAADNRTIDIQGQSLNIEAGKDVIHTSEQHEYKQSGLTLAFNSPVTDMAVAAVHTVEAAKRVENPRLKALYALKAAQQAKLAEMAFDGSAVQGVLNGTTSNGNSRNSDVKISLSVGSSKSTETSTGSTVTYTGSELNAGDIRLSTTDGDLSVSGSTLTAAHIALDSARNLLLTSVQNTEVNRTERKNSSWSAGVFAGKSGGSYGFGVEGAGAIGKGRENSDTVTQVNTHITGSRVKLHSEQDTALRGAVVNANKLNADIGGNLTIESRQDSNRYASRQSQANAGASIAIYGSGSNAYAGTSLNKGKVNYAQVEEQSGLTVGKEGMDVNVQGNTHLKGGLIQSEAPADKNRFRTDGLTTEDIENHSEISLQSLGGGISSDMFSGDMVGSLGKLGSANGWSAVVSALGGVNRDDKTLTRSAIGDNIALEIKTYKIPTALSRDTAHSNAKVQRYDKAEYEERLETAQLIGDISQNQIDIQWTPKVREAEAKRQQAEAVLNNQNATTAEKAEARQIKSQSEQIINTYGKGGDYQLAVRAVTGVLQGLATGNQNAAWVNGLSPYANNLIKTYTTDEQGQVNTTANLMAHAMLGALEAYATGNHAEVGAAGAITSEVAAKLITEQLYHTEPDKLTDDQKQVVATLSQVTAGLAGIIASDSTQSAVSAAEIGKRAVENNLLSRQEDKQVYDITEEYRSKGMLPKYKQEQVSALLAKDTEIDRLLYLYQTEPEKLTEAQKAYLDRELKVIAASYDIPVENLYQWDFSQVIKRDDSALKNYLSSGNALNDSYDMKQAQSLKQGLEVASVTGVNYGLVNRALGVLPKVGQAIEKYPLLTEMGATAIANTGYQLSQDRPYDPYGLLQAELSTVLTRNRSLGQQVSINVGISTLSAENDEDYGWNALGAGVGTLGSNYASKFNFGNKYGNQFLKPIFSNYTGEYLGDSDRIKLNINRVGGDIDENR